MARLDIEIKTTKAEKSLDGLQDSMEDTWKAGEQLSKKTGDAADKLGGSFEDSDKRVGASSKNIQASIASIISKYAAITAAVGTVAVAAKKGLQDYAQFQTAITEVRTLGVAQEQMKGLSDAVRDLAVQYGGTAQGQAQSLYSVISAGATDAAQAVNILDVANKLALGGVTDINTATDGLTSVLNAYRESGLTATEASDSLFVAMKGGKTTIGELASTLGQVAPLAANVGVGFDELNGAVSALTTAGVKTSEAVTQVRGILSSVIKPSAQAAKAAEELGIQFDVQAIKSKGLVGFLKEISEATNGNTQEIAKLFPQIEALNGVTALTGGQFETLIGIMEDMTQKTGETDKAAALLKETLDFKKAQLSAGVEDLSISFGKFLSPALSEALDFANNLTSALGFLFDELGRGTESAVAPLVEQLDAASQKLLEKKEALDSLTAIWGENHQLVESARAAYKNASDEVITLRQSMNELQVQTISVNAGTILVTDSTNRLVGSLIQASSELESVSATVGASRVVYDDVIGSTEGLAKANEGLNKVFLESEKAAQKAADEAVKAAQKRAKAEEEAEKKRAEAAAKKLADFRDGLSSTEALQAATDAINKSYEEQLEIQEELSKKSQEYSQRQKERIDLLKAEASGNDALVREINKKIAVDRELERLGGVNSKITREQIEADYERVESLEELKEAQKEFENGLKDIANIMIENSGSSEEFFGAIGDAAEDAARQLAASGLVELLKEVASYFGFGSGGDFSFGNILGGTSGGGFLDIFKGGSGLSQNGAKIPQGGNGGGLNGGSIGEVATAGKVASEGGTIITGGSTTITGGTTALGANTLGSASTSAAFTGGGAAGPAGVVAQGGSGSTGAAGGGGAAGAGVAAAVVALKLFSDNQSAKQQAHARDIFQNQVTSIEDLNGFQIRGGFDQSDNENFAFSNAANARNIVQAAGGNPLNGANGVAGFVQYRDNIEEVREVLGNYTQDVQNFQQVEREALAESLQGTVKRDEATGLLIEQHREQAEQFVTSQNIVANSAGLTTDLIIGAYGGVGTTAEGVAKAIEDGLITAAEAAENGLSGASVGMVSSLGVLSDNATGTAAHIISQFGSVDSSLAGVTAAIEDGFISSSEAAANGLSSLAVGAVSNLNTIGLAAQNAASAVANVARGDGDGGGSFNPISAPSGGSASFGGGERGRAHGGLVTKRGIYELAEEGPEMVLPADMTRRLLSFNNEYKAPQSSQESGRSVESIKADNTQRLMMQEKARTGDEETKSLLRQIIFELQENTSEVRKAA